MIPNNYICEGQMNIFDIGKQPYKITKPLRLIELFGGIGAQSMALERMQIPFEHYRLVEFDKYPVASYNAIHGTNFEPMDITKIHAEDLGIVDTVNYCYMMTYSFPCQDLSVAGKGRGMQKGSGTRSGLLWEVERLLSECKELPQVLIMENVPQVHGKKNKDDFQKWLDFLTELGYSSYWQDLNAKDYGVAQNRNRCFCVSILGHYSYKFPQPIELKTRMKDYLEKSVDEKYYIKNQKAKDLIDKLIVNKTIPDRQTDRQTDRQSTYASRTLNQSSYVTQSQLDTMQASASTSTSIAECVSTLGNLSQTNKTQSRTVYDNKGISPTLCSGMDHGNTVPYTME